ncbi:TRM7 [Hirschfeldia incana]|nr:TRM7 [Hirschfeldia incana]
MDIVERKRPRGAFLNLFDWPGKSRKKLFSSNISQISEESKQSNENVHKPSITRHSVFEVDQSVKNSAFNQGSNSSCCASSVTSDDGNAVKAPSVVARLMGLDCVPQPNLMEPRVNPSLDPYSLRSSRQANTWDANAEHHSDFDGVSWDRLESGASKGPHKRMIERFQTETLPPRSAKPISVTHSKLLSPIRNPGFVPSRNPAHVMEAASRMIESSPRMMARTRVVPSSDSSSPVPLRIRDLKEKLEAAQKASTSSCPQVTNDNTRSSKCLKGDQNQTKTTALVKSSCELKPPSFSAQPKSSRQNSLTTSSSGSKRTSSGQKEKAEAKNRAVKSQNGLKGASLSAGKNVLKQNHQKQNCRDNQQSRKPMNKVVNKVLVDSGSSSKSSVSTMTSSAERSTSLPLHRRKNLPRSKKPRNGVPEPGPYEDKRIKRGEKSIKCNISIDGDSSTSKSDQRRDTDVISFTFSSSIKGLPSRSQGTKQDAESAVKYNVIGGDSLNALLEQKLRELTLKIESSSSTLIQEECSSSITESRASRITLSPSRLGETTQNSLENVLTESESVSDCTSFYNNQKSQKKRMIQGEEQEVSSFSTLTETDDLALSSNKSYLDCRQDRECGMKQSSSDQELTWVSSSESHQTVDEADSASTLDWELEYITEILNSGQLVFQDFTSGATTNELVLPSSFFDEMERSRGAVTSTKIERKVLFECVNQCLAVKFERMLVGSCKGGMMTMMLEHRDLLAEEVNREVKGLKKMREMMIDELVDHDMSCFEGRWVGYEKEMFEEGIDIEGEIVSSLVDDLVSDLLSIWLS